MNRRCATRYGVPGEVVCGGAAKSDGRDYHRVSNLEVYCRLLRDGVPLSQAEAGVQAENLRVLPDVPSQLGGVMIENPPVGRSGEARAVTRARSRAALADRVASWVSVLTQSCLSPRSASTKRSRGTYSSIDAETVRSSSARSRGAHRGPGHSPGRGRCADAAALHDGTGVVDRAIRRSGTEPHPMTVPNFCYPTLPRRAAV